MFVRIKTRPNTNKKAVQIVKSIRYGKNVRQRVVQTVGYAFDEVTLNQLKDVAEHLKSQLEEQSQPTLWGPEQEAKMAINARKDNQTDEKKLNINITKLREEERFITGIHDVYGKIYKELGFDQLLAKHYKSASNILYHITMARLAAPKSKRASVDMLNRDFNIPINLDRVYRMMDKINDHVVKKAQKIACKATESILKGKIKVMFYDCTTLYFESFIPDDLKQNGYSKDGKFNQPQVLLALLVTEAGLPIGYELFPGSTF